jgi:hypothetical protein
MLVIKLALVTCAFYLGIAILLEAAFFGIAMWKGGIMYTLTRPVWFVTFGLFWLLSFTLAWRIVMGPFHG